MRLRPLLASTTLIAVLSGSLLVACGNDDDATESAATESAATETTAAASEGSYEVVPDAEVAKGLPEVVRLAESATSAVEAGAPDDATSTVDELYATWLSVEGTVKARDEDAYLDIEDALTLVKLGQEDGDGAKARSGADQLEELVAAYLAKFPGDGSEPPLETKPALKVEHKIAVTLSDYEITMPTPVPSGVVEFELENTGKETHELLVLKTDLTPEQLPKDAEGNVDERGAGVTLVDEKEGIAGGGDAELVVDLAPGRYVFLCNVAGHYAKKMYLAAEVQ